MREALSALPGVRHVYVDFKSKVVTVSIEKTNTDDDQRLIGALEEAGFGGSVNTTKK